MIESEVVAARTDAGLLALWSASAFVGVSDYPSWEARVDDRVPEAIAAGEFVPLNVGSDGAWGVRVAIAPGGLTDRERRYLVVTSESYLLVSSGGVVHVSGIEQIGDEDSPGVVLTDARYAVQVSLIAWEDEPGAKNPDGTPTAAALADFVVCIRPASGESFRVNELTFGVPAE